jgi:hypothetical protein
MCPYAIEALDEGRCEVLESDELGLAESFALDDVPTQVVNG